MMPANTKYPRRERGAALLLMLMVVVVAASALLVGKLRSGLARNERNADTQRVLAMAKQALIEYATTYSEFSPGAAARLPCPDIDATGPWQDGEAHTAACGNSGVAVMGRFPWKTLATRPYHDSSGTCLWYVVSGSYKNAAASTSTMINPDSNGQLQLYSIDSGQMIAGIAPEDRPVAMIIAPMEAVAGQSRAAAGSPGGNCSDDFTATDFLEADATVGVSNAALSASPYVIETFAVATGANASHNDRIISLGRDELAKAIYRRHDFAARMTALTQGVAACIAAYGRSNAAGLADSRLPWPAPMSMANYADDNSYDDVNTGLYSGRLPDSVDDSAGVTGSSVLRVLGDCDPAKVPEWNNTSLALWRTWKDHFFYVVADAFQPSAVVPVQCGNCLSINGGGQYAAMVFFSGERLSASAQTRNAPPIDADTRNRIGNYLEGANALNHPYRGGAADYQSMPATDSFNDIVICIDPTLAVTSC